MTYHFKFYGGSLGYSQFKQHAMSSIFEINKDYFSIFSELEENGGELTEELQGLLDENAEAFTSKVENSLKMIHKWDGEISTIDEEIKRLKTLKDSKTRSKESLKGYISDSLRIREIDKMDLGTHKLSFRKSEKIVVVDHTKIPDEFRSEKITVTFDKVSLKKYIKGGNEIEGIVLEVNQNLQIK